jgi:putative (di)nucleoside polyphosphate hydrolase
MSLPAQYFRAGAGAVIVNGSGLILALERADLAGAWQLPQGGLESSETPVQAALREVCEETGICGRNLELLDAYPEPLVYELPVVAQSQKTGRGQVQYWFFLKFHGADIGIDVTGSGESRSWRWVAFDQLLESAADFRKPTYRRLAEHFRTHIDSAAAESTAH